MTAMLSVALCAILIGLARAPGGDHENVFIFPTAPGPSNNFIANLAFKIGSTQEIQWATTIESYYIALFQQETDPPSGRQLNTVYTSEGNATGQQSLNWKVQLYDSDLSTSPVYFLWLNPGANDGFSSHYFNITVKALSLSSSSSSSASPSSASSTSPTFSAFASPTPSPLPAETSTPTPASPSGGGSSTPETLRVGLGVGLGIGIPLVLIAGIWIGLQSVKQRKASHSSRNNGSGVPLTQFPDKDPWPPQLDEAIFNAHTIHEALDTSNEPREMSGQRELIELGPIQS